MIKVLGSLGKGIERSELIKLDQNNLVDQDFCHIRIGLIEYANSHYTPLKIGFTSSDCTKSVKGISGHKHHVLCSLPIEQEDYIYIEPEER